MSKGIRRKLKILVIMVLVLSCAFALPCSAKEWTVSPTAVGQIYADYVIESGLDSGTYTMTGANPSYRTINGIRYYLINCEPLNYGEPASGSSYYSVSVNCGKFKMSYITNDVTDKHYYIYFSYAIGNTGQLFGMPNTTRVNLRNSQDDSVVATFNPVEKNNIAFVNGTFIHTMPVEYYFELVFEFGEIYGSDMIWSSATVLWISPYTFGRSDTTEEVIQNNIVDYNNEKNNNANANAENQLNNIQADEEDLINQMDNVFNQLPDISVFENEVVGVATTGNILLAVFNGFGDKFIHLWWILSTIGILATFIGLLIKRKKE